MKLLRKISVLLLWIVVLSTWACNIPPAEKPTPAATPGACHPPATWQIEFQRSGGFAGLMQSLTLSSDGKMTASDLRTHQSVSGTLQAQELESIASLLAQNCPFEKPRGESRCADCFLYTLKITMDGTPYQVEVNDVALSPNMGPLIELLTAQMQEMLAAPAK
ncbi:MAG: protealysin inhibitor emfourin [Anaerolineae bacterium]